MKQSKNKQSHFWFIKKGFIMLPQGWKGYLTIIIYAILMFTGFRLMDQEAMKNILVMFIFTCILLYIAYKKGEKSIWVIPKWKKFI